VFKSLKCQAEAGDALMKIVDTKMFGPAFTLRPLKADGVQVINWKIKKEKADAGPNQTPAPAGPAGLTKPTGPTSVSTKPQPPSMLDHPAAPNSVGPQSASTLELELEYFGYAEKRVELTAAAAEDAKKAHERLIAGER
jgi:hypothetical protein